MAIDTGLDFCIHMIVKMANTILHSLFMPLTPTERVVGELMNVQWGTGLVIMLTREVIEQSMLSSMGIMRVVFILLEKHIAVVGMAAEKIEQDPDIHGNTERSLYKHQKQEEL